MDTFTLNIDLGNDGMRDGFDIADALRQVAAKLDLGATSGKIADNNGNTVGKWSIK